VESLKRSVAYHQGRLKDADDTIRDLEAVKVDVDAPAPNEGYNTIHWNMVFKWGQALLDRLSWQLSKLGNKELVDMIAGLRKKRIRKELTFAHYVRLMGTLYGELYKRTGAKSFLSKRAKMAELWKRYHLADRENTAPYFNEDEVLFDPSERQYGETRISESELVSAIDLRSAASGIAKRHNVTFDEALSMLA
jgi:hypothetical protein